jgi:hypothetical protein
MSFGRTISHWLRSHGGFDMHYTQLGNAGNSNIVVPNVSNGFWPGKPHAGYIRIKQNTLNLNATVNIRSIVATDGTNIANIYPGDVSASGNNQYIDQAFFFLYDWPVTNISFNCVTLNNTATFDVEVAGIQA